jgi:hypothetical protein
MFRTQHLSKKNCEPKCFLCIKLSFISWKINTKLFLEEYAAILMKIRQDYRRKIGEALENPGVLMHVPSVENNPP